MPQVVLTVGALAGIERCRSHLAALDPTAARQAATVIKDRFQMLVHSPDAGRLVPDAPQLRELVIPFGKRGYVALYHHEIEQDRVLILAFRHQREAGY